ncbi:MAG: bifunctional adenosylcobinamide kinase/adenosylcobinamide-phosphate guanylyltransferase [Candidatus Omnitrophota bacterium]|nr:MAG: bifunctional adenosylcobinamide kinase/adenosylcobinamide-phosphate guanylyltransferase [Candidatus Omnitrophota bacterium]
MGKLKFIIGGARSGKSRFASETAKKAAGKVAFVATSQALDKEMEERIQLHKKIRPPTWQTFEEFKDIAPLIKRIGNQFDTIIIDCLTLYVSNLLLEGAEDNTIEKGVSSLIEEIKQIKSDVFIVSNEVGLGVVPDNRLARRFRDLAGRINQLVATRSDEVTFIACGIPMALKRR